MKRVISMILMLTLLASTVALVSCATGKDAGNSDKTGTTSKVENGEDPNSLPKMDFKGEVIKFAVAPVTGGNRFALEYLSCDADENDGRAIASAVYERNRKVEELLNVKIQVVYTAQTDEFKSTVRTSVNSGKNEYDVVFVAQDGMTLAKEGCIENIRLFDECYIDTDAKWWDSDYINAMHYADEVFWLAGSLSLTHAGGLGCFFVNIDMYNEQFKENYGDIHDIVRAGKWTFDVMSEMCAVVYDPINPSSPYISDEDVMGLRVTRSMTRALIIGLGVKMSSKNEGNTGVNFDLLTNLNDVNSRVSAVYKKTNENDKDGIDDSLLAIDQFTAGKQLFYGGILTDIADIANAKFEFTIIPNPMFNEEQKEYRTAVFPTAQVIGIVDGCQKTASVTATLEYMACLSNTMVEDVFCREILGEKYASNKNVAEMVDMLKDSTYTDFILCYDASIVEANWMSRCIMQDVGQYIFSRRYVYNDAYSEFLAEYVSRTMSGIVS